MRKPREFGEQEIACKNQKLEIKNHKNDKMAPKKSVPSDTNMELRDISDGLCRANTFYIATEGQLKGTILRGVTEKPSSNEVKLITDVSTSFDVIMLTGEHPLKYQKAYLKENIFTGTRGFSAETLKTRITKASKMAKIENWKILVDAHPSVRLECDTFEEYAKKICDVYGWPLPNPIIIEQMKRAFERLPSSCLKNMLSRIMQWNPQYVRFSNFAGGEADHDDLEICQFHAVVAAFFVKCRPAIDENPAFSYISDMLSALEITKREVVPMGAEEAEDMSTGKWAADPEYWKRWRYEQRYSHAIPEPADMAGMIKMTAGAPVKLRVEFQHALENPDIYLYVDDATGAGELTATAKNVDEYLELLKCDLAKIGKALTEKLPAVCQNIMRAQERLYRRMVDPKLVPFGSKPIRHSIRVPISPSQLIVFTGTQPLDGDMIGLLDPNTLVPHAIVQSNYYSDTDPRVTEVHARWLSDKVIAEGLLMKEAPASLAYLREASVKARMVGTVGNSCIRAEIIRSDDEPTLKKRKSETIVSVPETDSLLVEFQCSVYADDVREFETHEFRSGEGIIPEGELVTRIRNIVRDEKPFFMAKLRTMVSESDETITFTAPYVNDDRKLFKLLCTVARCAPSTLERSSSLDVTSFFIKDKFFFETLFRLSVNFNSAEDFHGLANWEKWPEFVPKLDQNPLFKWQESATNELKMYRHVDVITLQPGSGKTRIVIEHLKSLLEHMPEHVIWLTPKSGLPNLKMQLNRAGVPNVVLRPTDELKAHCVNIIDFNAFVRMPLDAMKKAIRTSYLILDEFHKFLPKTKTPSLIVSKTLALVSNSFRTIALSGAVFGNIHENTLIFEFMKMSYSWFLPNPKCAPYAFLEAINRRIGTRSVCRPFAQNCVTRDNLYVQMNSFIDICLRDGYGVVVATWDKIEEDGDEIRIGGEPVDVRFDTVVIREKDPLSLGPNVAPDERGPGKIRAYPIDESAGTTALSMAEDNFVREKRVDRGKLKKLIDSYNSSEPPVGSHSHLLPQVILMRGQAAEGFDLNRYNHMIIIVPQDSDKFDTNMLQVMHRINRMNNTADFVDYMFLTTNETQPAYDRFKQSKHLSNFRAVEPANPPSVDMCDGRNVSDPAKAGGDTTAEAEDSTRTAATAPSTRDRDAGRGVLPGAEDPKPALPTPNSSRVAPSRAEIERPLRQPEALADGSDVVPRPMTYLQIIGVLDSWKLSTDMMQKAEISVKRGTESAPIIVWIRSDRGSYLRQYEGVGRWNPFPEVKTTYYAIKTIGGPEPVVPSEPPAIGPPPSSVVPDIESLAIASTAPFPKHMTDEEIDDVLDSWELPECMMQEVVLSRDDGRGIVSVVVRIGFNGRNYMQQCVDGWIPFPEDTVKYYSFEEIGEPEPVPDFEPPAATVMLTREQANGIVESWGLEPCTAQMAEIVFDDNNGQGKKTVILPIWYNGEIFSHPIALMWPPFPRKEVTYFSIKRIGKPSLTREEIQSKLKSCHRNPQSREPTVRVRGLKMSGKVFEATGYVKSQYRGYCWKSDAIREGDYSDEIWFKIRDLAPGAERQLSIADPPNYLGIAS